MQTLLVIFCCLLSFNLVGQGIIDKTTTQAPSFKLSKPDGWQSEQFPIPIDFAPQIPYKGVEELRFAPGWDLKGSPGYWPYAFVWWVEGSPQLNASDLQDYLKAYYSGLVGRNITRRNIPADKQVATHAVIKKVKTTPQGEDQYSGTIQMLDYMAQTPMTLNCIIHVKPCKEQKHTAILLELSPKPGDDSIWKQLEMIRNSFECKGL